MLSIIVLIMAGAAAFYLRFPNFTVSPTTAPPPSLKWNAGQKDPSADRICYALYSLRQIAPSQHPEMSPTPLELLSLDPTSEPFLHPELSSHPGTPQYARLHEVLDRAEANVRAQSWSGFRRGDESMKRVVDALWLVGGMLRDDSARSLFLTRVQPSLGSGGQTVWSLLPFVQTPAVSVKALLGRTKEIEDMCWQFWVASGLVSSNEHPLSHRG